MHPEQQADPSAAASETAASPGQEPTAVAPAIDVDAKLRERIADQEATIGELREALGEAQLDRLARDQAELERAELQGKLLTLELALANTRRDSGPAPNEDPLTRDFEASTTKHTSAALAHAASNEPIFVLRGQDPLSGPLVRLWSGAAKLVGVEEAKVAQALLVADELDAWPRKKRPD